MAFSPRSAVYAIRSRAWARGIASALSVLLTVATVLLLVPHISEHFTHSAPSLHAHHFTVATFTVGYSHMLLAIVCLAAAVAACWLSRRPRECVAHGAPGMPARIASS